MRACWVLLGLAVACGAPASPVPVARTETPIPAGALPPPSLRTLDDRHVDFAFNGGQLDMELYREGRRVTQLVRNRYAVPIVLRWSLSSLQNLKAVTPVEGVVLLPAAPSPLGPGTAVELAELDLVDEAAPYWRYLGWRASFGDPAAQPADYAYGLPYPRGRSFTVLQAAHGAFSHRGSNENAVDFACPLGTPVLAARPGVIVATNGGVHDRGTTSEFLDYARTNFVLVLHDDGTLGEYLHLAPGSIQVQPGQSVERGQALASSGNTGFSSTPHLHFQVLTAARDGGAAQSFPLRLAITAGDVEPPIEGRSYLAWEETADV